MSQISENYGEGVHLHLVHNSKSILTNLCTYSCGNCSGNGGPRHLIVKGVVATGGTVIAGANSNYGGLSLNINSVLELSLMIPFISDTVTISNTCGATPAKMCQVYEGCDKAKGDCESEKLSTGFDGKTCIDGGGNSASC